MPGGLIRISRLVSLVGGAIFGIVGVLWSLVYVDRLTDEARVLSDLADYYKQRSQELDAAASQYFIANQQGDLIFVLASQGNARPEVAALIYKGNLLDRATPVRVMLGALAMAHTLDYRQAYDSYDKLNAKAREALSFAAYQAVKAREKDIVEQGQTLAPKLLDQQFQIRTALNANFAAQRRARTLGGVLSIVSTVLLLGANLITRRGEQAAASSGDASSC
jgi:hypothetical protein